MKVTLPAARSLAGFVLLVSVPLTGIGQTTPAARPDTNKDETITLESMIVTGTRRLDRTAIESMAPVDIISAERLQMSISPELADKIMMDVPSFDVQRLPIGETVSFIRPARLRNLSPDHTLVLVNGKRQHRTAGITNAGIQAVDLAQIPSSAIQRIEVLRDGASAQYGSDAIAGVMNIILKRRTGVEGYASVSEYFEGDGFTRQGGIDVGAGLGSDGFVNIALEGSKGERTSRSIQRPDAAAYVAAHPDRAKYVKNPVQPWGQPDRLAKRVMLNSELTLTTWAKLYAFGLYGQDHGIDDFNWRNPDTNAAFRRSIYQDGPSAIFPDFALVTLYPGGFLPLFSQDATDSTAVVGVKGVTPSKLSWDLSASIGRSVVDYVLSNSWNPSYGALSPTEFDVGGLRQEERNFNADFSYSFDVGSLPKPLNLAFGFESRSEEFMIRPGERSSWDRGPLIDLGVGANGYAGWTANQGVKAKRTSTAYYVDTDIQPTARLDFGFALRYENYQDFGSTTNGKISGRFEASNAFAVRATASTGFHAPTPGLSYYTRTSSGPLPGTQINSQTGLVSVNNPVAIFLGAKPLKPEKSRNYSLGVVYTPTPEFNLSLDSYVIYVDDRLASSQTFVLTDAQRAQLAATGVVDALNINMLNFFTNAFDTRTQGIDLVASYHWKMGRADRLTLTTAFNHNETKMLRAAPGLVSNEGRTNIERRLPRNVGNISVDYATGKLDLVGRVRYFGTWTDAASPVLVQTFSQQIYFDASATWKVTKNLNVTVGAENIFNRYPDKALFNVAAGLVYSRFAPYDTDGGRWYTRVGFSF